MRRTLGASRRRARWMHPRRHSGPIVVRRQVRCRLRPIWRVVYAHASSEAVLSDLYPLRMSSHRGQHTYLSPLLVFIYPSGLSLHPSTGTSSLRRSSATPSGIYLRCPLDDRHAALSSFQTTRAATGGRAAPSCHRADLPTPI